MKFNPNTYLVLSVILVVSQSCDEIIQVDLESAEPTLVVDAFINDLDQTQQIILSISKDYLDNTQYQMATGATVIVKDLFSDEDYLFVEAAPNKPGVYEWEPPASYSFGEIGRDYELQIMYEGRIYRATSTMHRVPLVDSILVNLQDGFLGGDDFYQAEFFSKDLEGQNDTYWIKSYKNGDYLNRSSEINLAFDAGPNQGNGIDGITFAPPIRLNINPVGEEDSDGNILTYELGDSIRVEIHSITNETFDYLTQLSIQTNRPGGFQELFADPLANLPVNIDVEGDGSNNGVLGYFSVSAVSSHEVIFTEDLIRE